MIVGVDISTHRIDLAYIKDGRPHSWTQHLDAEHIIDRAKLIWIPWHTFAHPHDVTEIAIEYPFSNNRKTLAHLMAIVGAVTHSAPNFARVAWPSAGDLRRAIGADNTKASAHETIRKMACPMPTPRAWLLDLMDWDEHELDALVACIAWTRILGQQDAA